MSSSLSQGALTTNVQRKSIDSNRKYCKNATPESVKNVHNDGGGEVSQNADKSGVWEGFSANERPH